MEIPAEVLTRIRGALRLFRHVPIGSIETRVRFGVWPKPAYAFGVYSAAKLARSLGIPAITAIEFGVGGGRGLVELERLAVKIGNHLGVQITVIGFDSGNGMPPPSDYRDLPHVWGKGFYQMDFEKLKAKLKCASLQIGDVGDTVPELLSGGGFDRIGFVSFDLDYYSSTKKALRIFEGGPSTRLPRVFCYFDDIIWPEWACHNEYVGELCAIREFNEEHPHRKLCQMSNLAWTRAHAEAWNEQTYVMHDFEHPLYTVNLMPNGDRYRQIPL
jgi:hypothetical protein